MIKILAECHADTQISRVLFSNCDTDHEGGHGSALKRLKETNHEKTIAFIDKSKTLATYFKECKLVRELPHGIELRKHSRGKKIIYLVNGLETFLIEVCHSNSINLTSYKLPSDQKSLGKRIKSVKVENDNEFKQLINTLKQKDIPVFKDIADFIKS